MRRTITQAAALTAAALITGTLAYAGVKGVTDAVTAPTRTAVMTGTAPTAPPATPGAGHGHPEPAPAPPPLLAARPVTTPPGVVGWALYDIPTGRTVAAGGTGVNTTESMIKTWVVADYLTRHPTPTADRLDQAVRAIRDSDNAAAESLYRAGGPNYSTAVVTRMIRTCGLTDTTIVRGYWSQTTVTAGDAARLGACLATGTAAGPRWTPWLLDQMRAVRGEGRFGPVDVLPGADVAMKNGWTLRNIDGMWHVNCLAVVERRWSLAVLTRYPGTLGLGHGAALCAAVTSQLAAV